MHLPSRLPSASPPTPRAWSSPSADAPPPANAAPAAALGHLPVETLQGLAGRLDRQDFSCLSRVDRRTHAILTASPQWAALRQAYDRDVAAAGSLVGALDGADDPALLPGLTGRAVQFLRRPDASATSQDAPVLAALVAAVDRLAPACEGPVLFAIGDRLQALHAALADGGRPRRPDTDALQATVCRVSRLALGRHAVDGDPFDARARAMAHAAWTRLLHQGL